jgi:NADH:ubiquinone oxidoreductase subunit 4 (subunit M)
MEFYNTHILTVVLFTPLVGSLVLLFVPRDSATAHRVIGNLFGILGLVVSLPLSARTTRWALTASACFSSC